MKLKNDDIVRLTEIKQYFLQPPYSFKLATDAKKFLAEAEAILIKYTDIKQPFFDELNQHKIILEAAGATREKLLKPLFALGKLLGSLTNK